MKFHYKIVDQYTSRNDYLFIVPSLLVNLALNDRKMGKGGMM